jgi:tRNA G18 (ribose-2'-O)-methylase SpoU
LQDFKVATNKKVAVIMGNEVTGVDQSVLDNCDGAIEVPQLGTKHSLNVSVCTGVVVWELVRQLRF